MCTSVPTDIMHNNFKKFVFRNGFLPWYKVPNSEQLLRSLGSAIPGSALVSKMTPSQTKSLMMNLWEDFFK